MRILKLYILTGLIGILSCRENVQRYPADQLPIEKRKQEALVKINNYVVKRNQELIGQFVKRTGLNLIQTGSGLWYGIQTAGTGKPATLGENVEISYTLKLLDGTLIDSIIASNPKVFTVGKGEVEAGLDEGILLLHKGDHAWFIIPPHLAYGNFGDQKKIPPGAFLFYDLFLRDIKP